MVGRFGPESAPHIRFISTDIPLPTRRSDFFRMQNEAREGALRMALPSAVSIGTLHSNEFGFPGGVGLGHGFAIDKGVIATNRHVVAGASQIEIQTSSMAPGGKPREQKVFSGHVLWEDPAHDIAFVGFDPAENPDVVLPPVQLGSNKDIHFGHTVMTVGAPLGFTGTFSEGAVSRLETVRSSSEFGTDELVQISAPVNKGNSGGMVFDPENNRVIGMVDAQGGDASLGLMIPVDTVKKSYEQFSYLRKIGRLPQRSYYPPYAA